MLKTEENEIVADGQASIQKYIREHTCAQEDYSHLMRHALLGLLEVELGVEN